MIKSLMNVFSKSVVVNEYSRFLREISNHSKLIFVWISGYMDIGGSYIGDKLLQSFQC